MKTPRTQIGLTWGIPTIGRPMPIDYVTSTKALHPPINYYVRFATVFGRAVADARNQLALDALNYDSRYVFFLGDDVTGPAYGLKQLIYRMDHDPEIGVCGGIYVTKSTPPFPLVFRGNGCGSFWDWRVGEFFEITGIGMDFTVVRTELLERLEPNWKEKSREGISIFPRREAAVEWYRTVNEDGFLDAIPKLESFTEDLYFCERVLEETDFKIYADSTVMCTHWEYIHPNQWRPWRLRADSRPMQRIVTDSERPLILDIGAGGRDLDLGGQVITLDIRDEVDPDYRCDARTLPFPDETFNVVFSSHVLEHFEREEIPNVLAEWIRVLKINGEIMLVVPTIEWAAKRIVEGVVDNDVANVLWGDQTHRHNFHKSGFTKAVLVELLEKLEIEIFEVEDQPGGNYNLIVRGRK